MNLFSSDLDNTLIYSRRHELGPDKICVEVYEGREVSFMRREWIESLKRIQRKFLFVPVTTRSVEQYLRLNLGNGSPQYALVCNGGVLLREGVKEPEWYKQSRRLTENSLDELHRAIKLLEQDADRTFQVRFPEELFVFTKSSRPGDSVRRLRDRLDPTRTDVFQNGEKVYVLPENLDKGTGLMRLRELLKPEKVFAAGDSEFDKPMLLAADLGMCPKELMWEAGSPVIRYPAEGFTTEIFRQLELFG